MGKDGRVDGYSLKGKNTSIYFHKISICPFIFSTISFGISGFFFVHDQYCQSCLTGALPKVIYMGFCTIKQSVMLHSKSIHEFLNFHENKTVNIRNPTSSSFSSNWDQEYIEVDRTKNATMPTPDHFVSSGEKFEL